MIADTYTYLIYKNKDADKRKKEEICQNPNLSKEEQENEIQKLIQKLLIIII